MDTILIYLLHCVYQSVRSRSSPKAMSSSPVAVNDTDKQRGPPEANGIKSDESTSRPSHEDLLGHWTDALPSTDHVNLFRSTDWATSILGPPIQWSPELRFATNMIFADSRGACVYWYKTSKVPDSLPWSNNFTGALRGQRYTMRPSR